MAARWSTTAPTRRCPRSSGNSDSDGRITSDEPVDVTLYDSTRTELNSWRGTNVPLSFQGGESCFLRVAGSTHTRYGLWIGRKLSPVLGRNWEEVHIWPKWWEVDDHPDWVIEPEEFRGILVDELTLADGVLHFGEVESSVLPEGTRIELLNPDGVLLREAETIENAAWVSVEGLEPGAYVLRIRSAATPEAPLALAPLMPPQLR